MAYNPIDLEIREMLNTDFITDLAQIHNINVLLLKDTVESLINSFQFDVSNISIGSDSPISSLGVNNIVIQDGGFIFQTGNPNNIISRLWKNSSSESVLDVHHINAAGMLTTADITTTNLIATTSNIGDATVSSLSNSGSRFESTEDVAVSLIMNPADDTSAFGTLMLTKASKENIYVTIEVETTPGQDQVWNGSDFTATLTKLDLVIDFDQSNLPVNGQVFTIHIVKVIENSGNSDVHARINQDGIKVLYTPSDDVIFHNDLRTAGLALGLDAHSFNPNDQYITTDKINASFIVKGSNQLMIKSTEGCNIFSL